jgi:hypothetical protein
MCVTRTRRADRLAGLDLQAYREMDMTYWLEKAESALKKLSPVTPGPSLAKE